VSSSFGSTRWSVVLAAGQRSLPTSDQALADLCQAYWFPLYAYVRRRVADVNSAQDLTQEFFANLLEKNILAVAQPERGRFRSFLLTALKNFLANEWERQRAKKRGAGQSPLSLDFAAGENRYCREPSYSSTAERLFDRHWALTLLEQVLSELRTVYLQSGKEAQFDVLKPFLTGSRELSLAEAAKALGLSEGAVKVAAHRLRQHYRDLLRTAIAHTLAESEQIDDEIRWLFDVLGNQ